MDSYSVQWFTIENVLFLKWIAMAQMAISGVWGTLHAKFKPFWSTGIKYALESPLQKEYDKMAETTPTKGRPIHG